MKWAAAAAILAGVFLIAKRLEPMNKTQQQNKEFYRPHMEAAEDKHGLPRGLLSAVAEKESAWRDDIIHCRTASPAGALGIMQIVPKWHPDAEPCDPLKSIDYAGGYLAKLHQQFGTWTLALAAYNWGPGNIAKNGAEGWPRETRDYVAKITTWAGVA